MNTTPRAPACRRTATTPSRALALAEDYAHEADALRASIAELSDELQQAKLERIENNILEFVEERPSAPNEFRTTLRGLDGGDTAFLRAQWSFRESGGCVVTPARAATLQLYIEAGARGGGSCQPRSRVPQRDTPDIFECWCFVKDGDGQMTKVTLRTTSLPADDAASLREEAAKAATRHKKQAAKFADAQQQYKDKHAGRSFLDTLLDYRELIKAHEASSVAAGARETVDSFARGADGAEVTLGDQRVVLGKRGHYACAGGGSCRRRAVELAARLLPFLKDQRSVRRTFTAARSASTTKCRLRWGTLPPHHCGHTTPCKPKNILVRLNATRMAALGPPRVPGSTARSAASRASGRRPTGPACATFYGQDCPASWEAAGFWRPEIPPCPPSAPTSPHRQHRTAPSTKRAAPRGSVWPPRLRRPPALHPSQSNKPLFATLLKVNGAPSPTNLLNRTASQRPPLHLSRARRKNPYPWRGPRPGRFLHLTRSTPCAARPELSDLSECAAAPTRRPRR